MVLSPPPNLTRAWLQVGTPGGLAQGSSERSRGSPEGTQQWDGQKPLCLGLSWLSALQLELGPHQRASSGFQGPSGRSMDENQGATDLNDISTKQCPSAPSAAGSLCGGSFQGAGLGVRGAGSWIQHHVSSTRWALSVSLRGSPSPTAPLTSLSWELQRPPPGPQASEEVQVSPPGVLPARGCRGSRRRGPSFRVRRWAHPQTQSFILLLVPFCLKIHEQLSPLLGVVAS